jgi:putative two-component system response regulator
MTENTNQKTILVVDDTPMNITLLAGILKGSYKVKVAKDGDKALKIAHGDPSPDLVLLDVMMPGMDGYEVCRLLKADDATRNIPVIFVTGLTDDADQATGMQLGAVGYLGKPVEAEKVLEKVREVLG